MINKLLESVGGAAINCADVIGAGVCSSATYGSILAVLSKPAAPDSQIAPLEAMLKAMNEGRHYIVESVKTDTAKNKPQKLSTRDQRLSKRAERVFAEHDLPPGLATNMLRIESNFGRHMISATGCKGWYQFCSRTARHYKLTKPHDFALSTKAAAQLARDNARSLRVYKVPRTVKTLYLAHMIGPYNVQTLHMMTSGKVVSNSRKRKLISVIKPNIPRGVKVGNLNNQANILDWLDKFSAKMKLI